MDEELKREFDDLCKELGLSMTAAFTVFAKTVVRQQRIPFEVSTGVPNAETIASFEEIELMKQGKLSCKGYTDLEEMKRELLS
jgi:DNA-damage-inducible protein J